MNNFVNPYQRLLLDIVDPQNIRRIWRFGIDNTIKAISFKNIYNNNELYIYKIGNWISAGKLLCYSILTIPISFIKDG